MKEKLLRFIKNKNFVTIAAAAACLLILIFSYNYRIKKETNPVLVYFAKEDIDAREEITEELIGSIKIPSSMVTADVVRNIDSILGKYVNYNTIIPAGSLFYSSVLVDWSDMPDSAWSDIEEGHTIVSLAVNVTTTYGNSIFPKDKIDLYYKTYDDSGKLVLGKLIEGIQVLAVKDDSGAHIFKKSPEQRQAAALIFSVPEELHLLLRKAMYLDGEIIPVPRNANYGETATIGSVYLKDLIENRSQYIPTDEELEAQAEAEANGDIDVEGGEVSTQDEVSTQGEVSTTD